MSHKFLSYSVFILPSTAPAQCKGFFSKTDNNTPTRTTVVVIRAPFQDPKISQNIKFLDMDTTLVMCVMTKNAFCIL